MVDLRINGVRHQVDADPDMPLLWAIRDIIGLHGTKFGCGIGACGACTVHVAGEAVRACVTPLSEVAGREITTIEGLAATAPAKAQGGQHPLQRAWKDGNVPQCGYCQPGQIMQAAALLKRTPHPTEAQIVDAMSGNVCRCGTYERIIAAIKTAAGVA